MIFSSTIISEKERERTLMAETICEASKPRSHKLTRGLSILGRVGGAVSPEGVVVLADIEAASMELVHSSVVAIKAESMTDEQEDIKGK